MYLILLNKSVFQQVEAMVGSETSASVALTVDLRVKLQQSSMSQSG